MRTTIIAGILLAFTAIGCSGASAADAAAENTAAKGTTSENDQGTAKSVSDPSSVKGTDSVRIVPPDPNDPKFKPDPKLGGGN